MIVAVDAKGWLQLGYSTTGISGLVDAFRERERERGVWRLKMEDKTEPPKQQ